VRERGRGKKEGRKRGRKRGELKERERNTHIILVCNDELIEPQFLTDRAQLLIMDKRRPEYLHEKQQTVTVQ
jgi:hypothetical protein